jgi:hypothetical protein
MQFFPLNLVWRYASLWVSCVVSRKDKYYLPCILPLCWLQVICFLSSDGMSVSLNLQSAIIKINFDNTMTFVVVHKKVPNLQAVLSLLSS